MGETIITKTITVKHSDGWGYRITGWDDGIEVVYFEKDGKEEKNKKEFWLDPILVKDVCKAILEISAETID